MKYMNRIAALLLAVLLLCALPATAYAHEPLDESRKGAITLEMEFDGKAVTGGSLTAYRVGQIQVRAEGDRFVPTPAMLAFPGSYEDITSPKLAEEVAAYVEAKRLKSYATVENQDGKAVFSDLELGLYLIVQTEASEGYEPLKPFLVSVPMSEDERYVYEVNAAGKFQLYQKEKPTEPSTSSEPTEPTDPKLPQTGQLKWPVPVLVIMGLCLFSAGWAMRYSRKKDKSK